MGLISRVSSRTYRQKKKNKNGKPFKSSNHSNESHSRQNKKCKNCLQFHFQSCQPKSSTCSPSRMLQFSLRNTLFPRLFSFRRRFLDFKPTKTTIKRVTM